MITGFKRILKFLPNRLLHQIFLILVVLVVTPLIILGTLMIRTSQDNIRTSVLRDNQTIAVQTTGVISENVKGAQNALLITASILGTLNTNAWIQETTIVELALRYPSFQRISSINTQGEEIVTSKLGTPLRDRSQEESFKEALNGKNFISEVQILDDHMPVLTLSVPVQRLGKITGVLMADLDLRVIWAIVDKIRLGKTGKALIVNERGIIIAHPDKKKVLKNETLIHPQIKKDLSELLPGSNEIIEPNGEGLLVSFAPIENLNWGLIITQSSKEAFAFIDRMKLESWILILASIIVTVFISLFLSQRMSNPIERMIEGTQRLARGDFSQTFRIKRRDEIGRLFYAFNRMTFKLKEARRVERLSTVGRAATAIAHELKNSLVLVKTFITLLPERHMDKDFIKDFSQTIPKELNSWNAMLQNMMEFSRSRNVSMTDIDMNVLVDDIVTLAKLRIQQKDVNLDVRKHDHLPLILGNEEKLKQVFINLVNNSIEAVPKGEKIIMTTKYVQNSTTLQGDHVEVKVTNTGKGISSVDFSRIFEPFYTTKDNGLGLGLSITKDIVDMHGGKIEGISEMDVGTSFTVKIPTKSSTQKKRS